MNTICSIIKFCWRVLNFIRDCVVNIIFLLFVFFCFSIIGVISLLNKQPEPLVGEQGALVLNLEGYLTDNRQQESWRDLLLSVDNRVVAKQYSVFDVVYAINSAADDDRIKGIVLDLTYFEGSNLPAINYIGEALNQFKQHNKPVIAIADHYGQSQYLLASYADTIYMNRAGQVDIHGFAMQNVYFKSLLEKLEVTPHVFRVGTYKSAVEPFLRNDMSAEARKNTEQWLTAMWQSYQQTVANNRNIAITQVLPSSSQYIQQLKNLNGDLTAYAVQRNLVDELTTVMDFNQQLIKIFGENNKGSYKSIDYDTYLDNLPDRLTSNSDKKIAVINVEGAIIDGESDDSSVGGDSIARLLRQAYHDDQIQAVILRINSPGGSAFASELIRQETEHLQTIGKPVVVSMGTMAASGGYWIASTADYIVADPNTITGSIGIFAMFPTFENTIKKAGIYGDEVATSELSQGSLVTPLSTQVKEVMQLSIEHGYDKFITLVSKGRHLTKTEVDQLAQGQIWLGSEAYQKKLVDELGDFDSAVAKARELVAQQGKTEELSVEWLEEQQGLWGRVFNDFNSQIKTTILQTLTEMIGVNPTIYQKLKPMGLTEFNDPNGQYLYCLNCNVSQ